MDIKFMILITLINIYITQAAVTIEVLTIQDSQNDEPKCTSPGIKCLDCWTSLNCIDLGNKTLYRELQHCPIGRTCKNNTGSCESGGNYDCSNHDKLKCDVPGVFPSPFNCKEYFTCVTGPNNELLKYVSKCNPSFQFDPVTKLCRRNVNGDNNCTSSFPVCQNSTQIGPLKDNPNIFYRCEKVKMDLGFNFVPQLYGCPFNFVFNTTHCVDPQPDVLDENGLCLNRGVFAHPTNCREYYDCSYIEELPSIRSCNYEYEKFDQLQGTCVYMNCDKCRI